MDNFWDRLGIFLSGLCAVHCVVTPFLVFTVPFFAYSFESPWFHWGLALLVVPLGLFAFIRGYRHHRQKRVLILGVFGLVVVGGAAVLPHSLMHLLGHSKVTLLGSASLILAHLLNERKCKPCAHACSEKHSGVSGSC